VNGFTLDETLGDGRQVYTYTIDAPANSTVNIAYTGSFTSVPASGQFTSGVGITPPTGFIDSNLNDNHATVTGKLAAPASVINVTGNTDVCYGINTALTANAPGVSNPEYKWYASQNAPEPFHTGDSYTTSSLTADTTFYLSVLCDEYCENVTGDRKEVTVKVSQTNYPDIRVRVCPDAGVISLAKYIDTVDNITDIQWAHQITGIAVTPEGTVSTGNLTFSRVHTLTYTVTSRCGNEQKRKIYLEVLRNGRMRPLKDTVEICHLQAGTVQINQLFGIEAGGTWSYPSTEYITESTSPTYSGAVVMNGKGIYENSSIPFITYHGVSKAKAVKFTYTADSNGCLKGKTYEMVIVLMED
jgi:hypothetical protein